MEFVPLPRPAGEWIEARHPVSQLDEMGRFEMGSTIVLAFPAAMIESVVGVKGKPVRLGDPLFRLKN